MNDILIQLLFENNIIDEKIYSFQSLLENRIEFIKKQHNGLYDPLIDHIASNIDPTKNKKYTQWVLNRMIAGDHVPDANTIKSSLEWYDKASTKSHVHDINKHNIQSMMDVAHLSKTSPKANKSANNVIKMYDKDGVTAFKINDKQSMINSYGPGRKHSSTWCTAAAGYDNMFDRYDGGKYTIHYPNGEYMHFHHQSEQAKDPSNVEINFTADKRYKDYNTNTKEIFEQTAKEEKNDNSLVENHFGISSDEFEKAFQYFKNVSQFGGGASVFKKFARRNKLTDEQFNVAVQNPSLKRSIYENPNLNDDQVTRLMDDNNTHWVDMGLHRNPSVKGHNVDKMLNEFENNPKYNTIAYKLGVMKNLENRHIDDIIEKSFHNPDYEDAIGDIIENGHKFSNSQINRLMDNDDHRHVIKIAEQQTVPSEHLKTAINKHIHDGGVNHFIHMMNMTKIMDHNNVDDNIVHKIIDESGAGSPRLLQIMNSKNVKRNHIDHIVNLYSNASYVPADIISHENFNHDDIDKMLFNNQKKGYQLMFHDELKAYLGRKDADMDKFRKANSDNLLNGYELHNAGYYKKKNLPADHFTDPVHAKYMLKDINYHPEFTHEDIGKILHTLTENDTYAPGSDDIKNLLDHPNVSPENIKHAYSNWGNDNLHAWTFSQHKRTLPSIKKEIEEKYGYRNID